jgi:hypothetical protein
MTVVVAELSSSMFQQGLPAVRSIKTLQQAAAFSVGPAGPLPH